MHGIQVGPQARSDHLVLNSQVAQTARRHSALLVEYALGVLVHRLLVIVLFVVVDASDHQLIAIFDIRMHVLPFGLELHSVVIP